VKHLSSNFGGLEQTSRPKVSRKTIQNRRYKYLREVLMSSDYFSKENMRMREPTLYHHYVGKYEQRVDEKDTEKPLYEVLLNNMDRISCEMRRLREEIEIAQLDPDSQKNSTEENLDISLEERGAQSKEFVKLMHERFLNGDDKGFDYSIVDANIEYDDIVQMQRDSEDAYFDSEELEEMIT